MKLAMLPPLAFITLERRVSSADRSADRSADDHQKGMEVVDVLDAPDSTRPSRRAEQEPDGRQHLQIFGRPGTVKILDSHRDHDRIAARQGRSRPEQKRMTLVIPRKPFEVQAAF